MRSRVLVVAPDVGLRARLARLLRNSGLYRVDLAENAEHARRIGLKGCALALVATDTLGAAGSTFMAELHTQTKVLLIPSTLGQPVDNSGLLDPADGDIMLARMAAVLRPTSDAEENLVFCFGGYSLDVTGRRLTGEDGREVPLTRGEFNLLREFVHRPGRVLSRDYLLRILSGREAEPYDRSIDMLVVRLRRKTEADPKRPTFISTVPGVGYKFVAKVQKNIGYDVGSAGGTVQSLRNSEPGNPEGWLPSRACRFRFGCFRVGRRCGLERLNGNGIWHPIELADHLRDMLIVLVERQGQLVPRQALTEAAWPGANREPDRLVREIGSLNCVLNCGREDCIETVEGSGYRFLPSVIRPISDDAEQDISSLSTKPRLSVVVFPFWGLSSDTTLNHYSEEMFDEFTAHLSYFPGAFVAATTTAATHTISAADIRARRRAMWRQLRDSSEH